MFATSKQMRYLIPWKPVPEVIDYFESEAAENGTAIAIMGDDGEKFGSWPGTYEWCYEKGWMEDFFNAIEQNSDWLEMITPGEYANRFPPLGRIYLPTASYAEMMEWSLPANVSTEFVEIEHEWSNKIDRCAPLPSRRFLAQLPGQIPGNKQHAQENALRHDKVWRMPDGPEKEEAKDQLWMGQCNCRSGTGSWGHLLHTHSHGQLLPSDRGEKIADRQLIGGSWASSTVKDFDADSLPEVLLESNELTFTSTSREAALCSAGLSQQEPKLG